MEIPVAHLRIIKRFLQLPGKLHGSETDNEPANSTPDVVVLPWCCSRSQEPAVGTSDEENAQNLLRLQLLVHEVHHSPNQEKRAKMQFPSLQKPILHHGKCPIENDARRAPPSPLPFQTRPPRPPLPWQSAALREPCENSGMTTSSALRLPARDIENLHEGQDVDDVLHGVPLYPALRRTSTRGVGRSLAGSSPPTSAPGVKGSTRRLQPWEEESSGPWRNTTHSPPPILP